MSMSFRLVTLPENKSTICLNSLFNKIYVHLQCSQCPVLNVRALRFLPMKCGATVSLVNFFAWAMLCPGILSLLGASAKSVVVQNAEGELQWAIRQKIVLIIIFQYTPSSFHTIPDL